MIVFAPVGLLILAVFYIIKYTLLFVKELILSAYWMSVAMMLAAQNAKLRSQIVQLRNRISRLEREIERLKGVIACLRETLKRIAMFCVRAMKEASKVLSKDSGVPRGQWAFCRGAYEIAERCWRLTKNSCG